MKVGYRNILTLLNSYSPVLCLFGDITADAFHSWINCDLEMEGPTNAMSSD
jgi:hypothetical protein